MQLLNVTAPLKFGRAKNVQNLARFTEPFEFLLQISLERIELSTSGKKRYQAELIVR